MGILRQLHHHQFLLSEAPSTSGKPARGTATPTIFRRLGYRILVEPTASQPCYNG